VLAVLDREHPFMIRQRLHSFLRVPEGRAGAALSPIEHSTLRSRVGNAIHGS
jgi:hypothetical protein